MAIVPARLNKIIGSEIYTSNMEHVNKCIGAGCTLEIIEKVKSTECDHSKTVTWLIVITYTHYVVGLNYIEVTRCISGDLGLEGLNTNILGQHCPVKREWPILNCRTHSKRMHR